MTELQAIVLLRLLEATPGQQAQIVTYFPSITGYFTAVLADLPAPLAAVRARFDKNSRDCVRRAQEEIDSACASGIGLIGWHDATYPALLREIHQPPLLLYVLGDVTALSLPQIAVIGSRNASRSGLGLAESFAAALAASGFAVTSGLALGIDGAAHRGALKNGTTIAVLGAGVDVIYPRQHAQLYRDIVTQGGAVISELPPGTPPLRGHFPRRNRIISGLSAGVLVVEAALKSGSLITARLAMEQGREVFAVPGSIHNPLARGCHQLIRSGAMLTETVEDIASQLGGMLAFKAQECVQRKPLPANAVDAREQELLSAMGFDPVDFDTLSSRVPLAPAELMAALLSLELHGWIESRAGLYQRIA